MITIYFNSPSCIQAHKLLDILAETHAKHVDFNHFNCQSLLNFKFSFPRSNLWKCFECSFDIQDTSHDNTNDEKNVNDSNETQRIQRIERNTKKKSSIFRLHIPEYTYVREFGHMHTVGKRIMLHSTFNIQSVRLRSRSKWTSQSIHAFVNKTVALYMHWVQLRIGCRCVRIKPRFMLPYIDYSIWI